MSQCGVCGLSKLPGDANFNAFARCRCGVQLESPEGIKERAEYSAAMQKVCFRTCKGFADPSEVAEFRRLWKQSKESGSRKELDAWTARMNARFRSK